MVQVVFQMAYLIGILVFILPPGNMVRELYNYSTQCPADGAQEAAAAQTAEGGQAAGSAQVACDTQDT